VRPLSYLLTPHPWRTSAEMVHIFSESWENKGKFPPALKPPLAKLAILAIRLDEYDEDFFSLMPTLFPYNKFTMTVRLVYLSFFFFFKLYK
jgi:hypothetical protein